MACSKVNETENNINRTFLAFKVIINRTSFLCFLTKEVEEVRLKDANLRRIFLLTIKNFFFYCFLVL
jgi:hypothetical protein